MRCVSVVLLSVFWLILRVVMLSVCLLWWSRIFDVG